MSEMLHWAYVTRNPAAADHTRQYLLAYRYPALSEDALLSTICPVGIRVQGDSLPQSAVQFVVLGGGAALESQFREYVFAIEKVIDYIYHCVHYQTDRTDLGDSLYVSRRVFTKITAKNRAEPSALAEGDDPHGDAAKFGDEWRVVNKARVGKYVTDSDGTAGVAKVPWDPVLISAGDFVDVCVGFEIASLKNKPGVWSRRHKVHLSIQHILLLQAAADTEVRCFSRQHLVSSY
ncbi:hypothetical protein C8J57DRAFT_1469916 [Mycena rebaudengoi]|nr:hypothetical protein C8J57DRAFT_1469916 [Mycena rebaudengoi]